MHKKFILNRVQVPLISTGETCLKPKKRMGINMSFRICDDTLKETIC